MESTRQNSPDRRSFLKTTCLAAAGLAAGRTPAAAASETGGVSLVLAPDDPVASAAPARWALGQLREALEAQGAKVRVLTSPEAAPAAERCVLAAGGRNRVARQVLGGLNISVPSTAEGLGLAEGRAGDRGVLLACGHDTRGLVYALLELADRVRLGEAPLPALEVPKPVVERPANIIRSIYRCFVSEVEDKPWFYDRAMWKEYLSLLAAQRINRFSLTFGMGYNTPNNIRDSYFFFAYPFLLAVPGYDVRAVGLPEAERDRNLEMLQFISDQAAARGTHFQLGLWSHGRDWPNSDKVNYPLQGLTAANHAPYCRDALAALLAACPAISGLTFRIHGESGVPDGTFQFWTTLFDAFAKCGRRVEIDMHAKGMTQKMMEIALATGMPVNASPKYWGEHMGLGYHQAAIRDLEIAHETYKEEPAGLGLGSRSFLRYGYGDLMTEDRRYGILHRVWPGTQRLLLSGDPALAAGYGRASSFCGSLGVELPDPLTFKGRQGSGLPGGRGAYADKSLDPKYDWQKFAYTYRVWGRLTYNPDSDPEVWLRCLRKEFQDAAEPAGDALAGASRILPLVTTAHGVSTDCASYWPELYTNMPIVDPKRKQPYGDTADPKKFGNVSPLDPQLFARIDEFADGLLAGTTTEKVTPLDVAHWLEDLAHAAAKNIERAEARVGDKRDPAYRRLAADVAIQSGVGLFFAWKMRSAVLWRLYEKSGDATALDAALKAYRAARKAWAEMAEGAKAIYVRDITFGEHGNLHGHWIDRLPAIDDDLADMQKRQGQTPADEANKVDAEALRRAIRIVLEQPRRPALACRHTPARQFGPGEPLPIDLSVPQGTVRHVRLFYRHVNQAVRWQVRPMDLQGDGYHAAIPAEYTQTRYPLQYYFAVDGGDAGEALYPGLDVNRADMPYFVVRRNG